MPLPAHWPKPQPIAPIGKGFCPEIRRVVTLVESRLPSILSPFPPDVRYMLQAVAIAADATRSMKEVGEAYGWNLPLIAKRLQRAEVPSLMQIHRAFRTVYIVALLGDEEWSAFRTATALGFSNAQNMSRFLSDNFRLSTATAAGMLASERMKQVTDELILQYCERWAALTDPLAVRPL